MTVGILGGTGAQGTGLARRLAVAGVDVMIGSRSAERAAAHAAALSGAAGNTLRGAANDDVVQQCDVVFLVVPFDDAPALMASFANSWRPGAIAVDVTVPLTFENRRPELRRLPAGSASATLAAALPPGVRLVGALKTIPAGLLQDVDVPLDCDDFVVSDDADAARAVRELLSHLTGLRPLDAGGLASAASVEAMTLLALVLNRRHKVKDCRFRVQGVP